jgi:hypothetical protein
MTVYTPIPVIRASAIGRLKLTHSRLSKIDGLGDSGLSKAIRTRVRIGR